jgi:hypothetical protein
MRRVGSIAIDAGAAARIIQARAAQAGFDAKVLGGHSLKRGELSTGMDRNVHPTRRYKTYAVLDEYLELGDPFEGHPLSPPAPCSGASGSRRAAATEATRWRHARCRDRAPRAPRCRIEPKRCATCHRTALIPAASCQDRKARIGHSPVVP